MHTCTKRKGMAYIHMQRTTFHYQYGSGTRAALPFMPCTSEVCGYNTLDGPMSRTPVL